MFPRAAETSSPRSQSVEWSSNTTGQNGRQPQNGGGVVSLLRMISLPGQERQQVSGGGVRPVEIQVSIGPFHQLGSLDLEGIIDPTGQRFRSQVLRREFAQQP